MTWMLLLVTAIVAACGAFAGCWLILSAADEASRERVRLSDGNITREISGW